MGKIYLVGAGPGAVDLITLRCARLLAKADIVFYDALVGDDIVALAKRAKKISVGKRCGKVSIDQRFINRRLVEAAHSHSIVVRLKGGDPMMFGRAHEEIQAIREANIAYEIVPGVTAALAAASELGVSLTRRGLSRSVSFFTPRVGVGEETGDWVRNLGTTDTAILYMASQQLDEIIAVLIDKGIPPTRPIVIIENISLPHARKFFTSIGELQKGVPWKITGPAIVMLGEVFSELCARNEYPSESISELNIAATGGRKTA